MTEGYRLLREIDKVERDNKGNVSRIDFTDGSWERYELDKNGRPIFHTDSKDHWEKYEYDENSNIIYYEDWQGYWYKKEYDSLGNKILSEDCSGMCIGYYYDNDGKRINHKVLTRVEGDEMW